MMNQQAPDRHGTREAMDERASKALLAAFDVPVVREEMATEVGSALAAADRLGYPVVVKGFGKRLLHKSERALVHVGISDADALKRALAAIAASGGQDVEGFLLQPQVRGRRELVAGLFRDPHFGAVVMLGLGGVFTEVLSDVTFRLAPLSPHDPPAMLADLRSAPMFGSFRGEEGVDRGLLQRCVMGLSRLAQEHPEIAEVDINPLIVSPDGRLTAVDALVIKAPPAAAPPPRPSVSPRAIGALFHPHAIAFVGASARMGKWGHMLFTHTISGGYQGAIHLVNPKGGRIAGREVFRAVEEIPGPVDLAVVTVPAAQVLALMPGLQRKGVRYVVLISSGFGETGTEGKALEQELVLRAGDAGILVLGPNTMGICNPHLNLYCTGSPVRPRPGATAVVAQSGNMGTQLLAFAEAQGVGIRGFSGSGNEAMITIEDYIEGFEHDPLTRTVMLYVESVKDGRRFFESARRVGRLKPVVLLKGGRSAAGNRAAASHTGALAADTRVFDAVCRQAGIVQVKRPVDLLDLAAVFSSLPLPAGNRAAVMTLGGGWGVVTADLCAEFGLQVPMLPPEQVARIGRRLPPYWSHANPVDIVGENDPELPLAVMEELLAWEGCDAVIHLGILGRRIFAERMADAAQAADPEADGATLDMMRRFMRNFEERYVEQIVALMTRYKKPVIGVSLLTDASDRTVRHVDGSPLGAVFFPTPERAVQAFARMVDYAQFLKRTPDGAA